MCHPLQPHSSAVATGLGGLCCCQRDKKRPGPGGRSQDPQGPPGSQPKSLCLDIVLPDGCLATALAAVLLLSFINLHGILPIQTTIREEGKFLSAFRLPFIPTKRSVREGHALPPSQLLIGCWEQGILTYLLQISTHLFFCPHMQLLSESRQSQNRNKR